MIEPVTNLNGLSPVEDWIHHCEWLEQERDKWLRIAQRLFKERMSYLHGHTYDLKTDDALLTASILEWQNTL